MYQLTNVEKETIILWNEAEPVAEIATFDRRMIKRLMQLTQTNAEAELVAVPGEGEYRFKVPKAWFKVKPPRTASEAERQRLKAMGFSSKNTL